MRRICAALLLLLPACAWPFAEDLCPVVTGGWRNCALHLCAPDSDASACSAIAMMTTVASQAGAALQGSGARSSVHTDATYYLAQAAGFSARDAYTLASFDEAVDLGRFVLRDETGALVVDADLCKQPKAPALCRQLTPQLGGANRNNFDEGGVFFHFQAPPVSAGRLNGLAPDINDPAKEPFLYNLRQWVYGRGPLCVGGLVQHAPMLGCFDSTNRDPPLLVGRIPFLTESKIDSVDWAATIKEQPLVTDPDSGRDTPASQLGHYVPADQLPLARLGIYLHAVQDRISHHRCIDASSLIGPRPADAPELKLNPFPFAAYEGPRSVGSLHDAIQFLHSVRLRANPDYIFRFDPAQCDQMDHAARHALETGTDQSKLDPADRTTEPALRLSLIVLQGYARREHFTHLPQLSAKQRERIISDLLAAIETPDATGRIAALDVVAHKHGWLTLPGYGGLTPKHWQKRAGKAHFAAAR